MQASSCVAMRVAAQGALLGTCRFVSGVAAQAAVEEGIVIGGGCTLLRLAQAVDGVKGGLDNDEQKARSSSLNDVWAYTLFATVWCNLVSL